MKRKETCPKCGKYKLLTNHHIFPRRHWRPTQNSPVQRLCRKCHDDLEKIILRAERQPRSFYWNVVKDFLSK